ncbi:MAG: AAA family ATPase, partial [Gallionellaceae bacterium]
MQSSNQSEYDYQRRLISALMSNIGNVHLHETHISWVLVAGRYAYKIKKAVDLGFLDFSSLQARRFYCAEEIRLNRRLAPNIYLDVIAIGGSVENPVLGQCPAIEYAVRMHKFPVSSQLDRLAARNKILPQHIDALAALVAKFHLELPASKDREVFGTTTSVRLAAEQNFEQLQALFSDSNDLEKLAVVRRASESEFTCCQSIIEERLLQGFVRECHGDLHLGNIVLIDDQPIPFDGIEFNPELRWMDVISEVAFTVMDLQYFKLDELAYRFLNDYLEIAGDYAGVKLLPFYMAYRAMVRAKVNAIRANQSDIQPGEKKSALFACREYMALAARCFASGKPALIITYGLPGSGKSTFAQLALERLQAIRLRSDVERKR